jgi:hypothetical protein
MSMKSSFQSVISFFELFCNCQLSSVPLLSSSYPGRLASRNSTRFNSMLLLPASEIFLITTLHGSCRKHSLSIVGKACLQRRCGALYCCFRIRCRGSVFTESLPSSERYIQTSLFQLSGIMSQYNCPNKIGPRAQVG